MPFIPHTKQEIEEMLAVIGIKNIDQLFDEIPASLPRADISHLPHGLNEMEIMNLMEERAPKTMPRTSYLGAGAYEHYIPAAVWQIVGRGEFYTAYTPYQAEASQGSLQLMYEYQTMMAELMAMDVSNASLYEGASALTEACLMAVRLKKMKNSKVLVPAGVNPAYRRVLLSMLKQQEIGVEIIDFDSKTGTINQKALENKTSPEHVALVIPQPNYFGCLEDVDQLTNWAHQHKLLVIGVVNPTAMALLNPPGQWGDSGADIVCGEGQPLGIPLSYGGPYFGFLCCKKEYVRQMPGRIVGETHDDKGRVGYTLTLQAREQHIRRAKATSNICTNQGLMVVAATIYLSLLGAQGLRDVAIACHQNAKYLQELLIKIPGVKLLFHAPFWDEFAIELPKAAESVIQKMQEHGIQAGIQIKKDFPHYPNALLICVTETKKHDDLKHYTERFKEALQ